MQLLAPAAEVPIVYGGDVGCVPNLGGCDGGLGFCLHRDGRECGGRVHDLGPGDGTTFHGRVDDHVPRDSVRIFSWNRETETLTYASADDARETISPAVCVGRTPYSVAEVLVAVRNQ